MRMRRTPAYIDISVAHRTRTWRVVDFLLADCGEIDVSGRCDSCLGSAGNSMK